MVHFKLLRKKLDWAKSLSQVGTAQVNRRQQSCPLHKWEMQMPKQGLKWLSEEAIKLALIATIPCMALALALAILLHKEPLLMTILVVFVRQDGLPEETV